MRDLLIKTKEDFKAIINNGLLFRAFGALLNKNFSKFKQYLIPKWITRVNKVCKKKTNI